MAIKFNQLTGLARTEVKVLEPNESGQLEELVHSPKHKRITNLVLQQLDKIEAEIKAENEQKNAKLKNAKDRVLEQKNIMAHQLAYLIEDSDIIGNDGQSLPPTPEFYASLSANYCNTTFWALMGTVFPSKKNLPTSSDGMSPEVG